MRSLSSEYVLFTQLDSHLDLNNFDIEHCNVTNNTVQALGQLDMPNLQQISFKLCPKLEDEAMAIFFRKKRTSITKLNISGCSLLTDAAVKLLVPSMPNLRILSLQSLYRITDASVAYLFESVLFH